MLATSVSFIRFSYFLFPTDHYYSFISIFFRSYHMCVRSRINIFTIFWFSFPDEMFEMIKNLYSFWTCAMFLREKKAVTKCPEIHRKMMLQKSGENENYNVTKTINERRKKATANLSIDVHTAHITTNTKPRIIYSDGDVSTDRCCSFW